MRCERLLEKDSCKKNRNSPSCKRWQFALNGCSEQRGKKGGRLDENKDDDEEYAVVMLLLILILLLLLLFLLKVTMVLVRVAVVVVMRMASTTTIFTLH